MCILGCSCREEEKDAYLYYILSVHGQGRTIVFCTSIAALRRISSLLRILGINVWTLHSEMQQRARLKVPYSISCITDWFHILFVALVIIFLLAVYGQNFFFPFQSIFCVLVIISLYKIFPRRVCVVWINI